jgi:hypothetical protein
MKESYEKGLANRLGPEPYAGGGNVAGVALGMGTRRPGIELRNQPFRVPTLSWNGEGNTGNRGSKASGCPTRRSHRPCACVETPNARTGRSNRFPLGDAAMRRSAERSENVSDGNADMHADRKSDGPIVPAKRANKTGTPAAELVEERGSLKGNDAQHVLVPDTAPGLASFPAYCASTARRAGNILTVPTRERSRMR